MSSCLISLVWRSCAGLQTAKLGAVVPGMTLTVVAICHPPSPGLHARVKFIYEDDDDHTRLEAPVRFGWASIQAASGTGTVFLREAGMWLGVCVTSVIHAMNRRTSVIHAQNKNKIADVPNYRVVGTKFLG